MRSTYATRTDIEPEDDGEPGEPVSVDDVMEIHEFLQGFDGDFRRSSRSIAPDLPTQTRWPAPELERRASLGAR